MVLETGNRLAARGHQVDCICIRADRQIVGEESGICFHPIDGPLSSELSFWLKFKSGCERVLAIVDRLVADDADAILFPTSVPCELVGQLRSKASPTLKLRVVLPGTVGIYSFEKLDLGAALAQKTGLRVHCVRSFSFRCEALPCVQMVLVNSQYSLSATKLAYGYSDRVCEVVYLGVDGDRFSLSEAGNARLGSAVLPN